MTMSPSDLVDALVARMEDEEAALAAGDLAALGTATTAKLALVRALAAVPAGSVPRARLQAAADCNRAVARRVNLARARVDARLTALARASGLALAGAYGPDGRPVVALSRR